MQQSAAPILINTRSAAGVLVAAALLASSVVFSEPAPADVLMMGVIAGIPILGAGLLGRVTTINLVLWLVIVALGLAGTVVSTQMQTAIVHQLVTLYLALGAVVLAAYVAADPEPRFRLVIWCYVIGCLIASVAAIGGYFKLIPGMYDLFTNYDRARGTFKDPNVYGAAVAPGIVLAVWMTLRDRAGRLWLAALVAGVLGLGLLLSFSRGAWFSVVVSIAVLLWLAIVTSRRNADLQRFAAAGLFGSVVLACALTAAFQNEAVSKLLDQRASLDQSYDNGPEGRFGGQEKAKSLILDHPFGIGTHTFRDTYHHEEPHNVYLSMFLNAGWIGGLLYIVSVLITLFVGLRGAMQRGALQGPFIVATSAFFGLALEGLIIDSDHWRHFFIVMGLIWGLSDAAAVQVQNGVRQLTPRLGGL